MTFGNRLSSAIEGRGRLCVGIDPHPALLDSWGFTDSPFGLERFAMTVVEALAGTVPVIKPQSAFFERHGSRGIAALERLLAGFADTSTLTLLDVKRVISASAIWMALSAAPLRRLSETTHISRPLSTVESVRMRLI